MALMLIILFLLNDLKGSQHALNLGWPCQPRHCWRVCFLYLDVSQPACARMLSCNLA